MALAAIVTACGGELRSPVGLEDPGDRPVGQGGRASPLIGSWETILVIDSGYDLQEWVTRWSFSTDRSCRFERTTFSFVEGISRTVKRTCTYLDQSSSYVASFDGGAVETIPYSVPLNSTSRLVIQGIEYYRIQ